MRISDVSDYLRQTLELAPAQRLYARLRNLARLPLYLWMFKEVSGSGDLPADRGGLLRSFVCAPRLLAVSYTHLTLPTSDLV